MTSNGHTPSRSPWLTPITIAGATSVGAWSFVILRWYNDENLSFVEGITTQPGFSVIILGLCALVGFVVWWAERGWLAEGWSPAVVSRILLAPAAVIAIVWLISTR